MFWNRNHAQEQQRVARLSFRPQLECLETRTLLTANVALDLSQAIIAAVHLQGLALQQDLNKIQQDINALTSQPHQNSYLNLPNDISNFYTGVQTAGVGAAMFQVGQVLAYGLPGGNLTYQGGGL